MKAKQILRIVASFAPFAISAQAEAYTWHTYGGHEYAVTSTYQSWVDAQAEAVSAGGHLVTINDAAENAWLAETFKATYIENNQGEGWGAAFNIGYYYNATNGTWGWISGETSSYVNLYHDWDKYTGPYGYMHTALHPFPGTWNHASWHTEPPGLLGYAYAVIERVPVGIPEPASLALLGMGLAGLAGLRRRKV